ncbi:HD-GYP domain-containing protein [Desertibacillus haloalkaliphilus]|uniref:HD-GYP domain-containing protein n=1 Tax=Desertibacillus haloalkaliphilus TaxID=1328930 RepID=UPI001C25990A|nr:HD-GYP domain-containing protein [Desertibacillus haloalkaliphilus]MBU8905750.1 HD-GYP domain-containing protein [Desertibacillus haloalkaliphilus]
MKVKTKQLQEGCILAEDVKALTNHPLVRKKTVLTEEHLQVLDAFLIDSVIVEDKLINGDDFRPPEITEERVESTPTKQKTFIELYLQAVNNYKKEFKSWQSGKKIEIINIRALIMPLLEEVIRHPSHVFSLHHYQTKEDYLYHHAVAVSILSAYLGKKIGLTKGEWIELGIAGALCDCGMARISETVLRKKGALYAAEYEEVKKHPIYSYQMLKGITGVSERVLLAVLQHHEREDGSGYPLGTTAKKNHQNSKICAVADIYHAMTSERYYRSKQSPFKVLELISKDQFGQLDHRVVQTLLNSLLNFSIGTRVRLSNGEEADILYIDQQAPTRPIVKLVTTGEVLKLITMQDLHIEEVLH